MSCYSPITLYRSKSGRDRVTGRWPLSTASEGYRDRPVDVACGRCVGCRLDRSRVWATRLMHELKMHESAYFVTLTYDDEHLVWGSEFATLFPPHVSLFIRSLRKRSKQKVRYYAVGEYGESTGRPHYHAILFGLHLSDLKFHSTSNGHNLYTSKFMDSVWSYGHVTIGSVTFESCAYCARYMMKKQYGQNSSIYSELGVEPEFARMSLKPGIGLKFYEKFESDIFPADQVVLRGGVRSKPPRYYFEKYAKSNPKSAKKIVLEREAAAKASQGDNTPRRRAIKEVIKKAQITLLKRKL